MEQIDICQLLSCALQGKQLMVHAEAERLSKLQIVIKYLLCCMNCLKGIAFLRI